MFFKGLLLALLMTPATAMPTAPPVPLTAQASPTATEDQLAAALVERLVNVCASHPEVERAFLLVKKSPDGSPTYTFIPIFDRDVSDAALDDADKAYAEIFPSRGRLSLMLLTRSTWKKSLGGVPPIYRRPGK